MASSTTHWTEVGVFWTSAVLTIITITATLINYLFFRSQIEPDVLIYVTPDERRPTIILLVITNVGNGLARDITFKADRPIPERAFGLGENVETPRKMTSGPLITGIPSLGPGAKRVITWGQYGGLTKSIGDDVINVEVRYRCRRSICPGYKCKKAICPVDIRSFAGTNASDQNWDRKLYEEVKSISSVLQAISSGQKPISIRMVGTEQS